MQSKHVPEHRVREAVNPRTGRRERVFVDLEAVYPDYKNPNHEVSFEELRAISRGWGARNWRAPKEPLKEISGNASSADTSPEKDLPEQFEEKLSVKGAEPEPTDHGMDHDGYEGKAGKARKLKLREVKGETQTGKTLTLFFVALTMADSCSQNEFWLSFEEQSPTQEHSRTYHDHAHSRCYR